MNIDKFKNAIGGGVRPSLFRVKGNIGTTTSPDVMSFLVTAAQLPASTLGRNPCQLSRSPDQTTRFSNFLKTGRLTILNDEGMFLRSRFEKWMDDLNGAASNVAQRPITLTNAVDFPTWSVDQLNRNGQPIKSYELLYCFPTSVSAMDLAADADGLSDFQVSFILLLPH